MTDWEDKIENCDPRVKWAMEVMDQEGEVFEGLMGKVGHDCVSHGCHTVFPLQMITPLFAGLMPLCVNLGKNAGNRVPLRSNFPLALALTVPFTMGGWYFRSFFDRQVACHTMQYLGTVVCDRTNTRRRS